MASKGSVNFKPNATPVTLPVAPLPSTGVDPAISAGIVQAMQDAARAKTPSFAAQQAAAQAGAPMPTSGVDQVLNPFVQPEGVPQGVPTDLSSLFGMGAGGGLGPVAPVSDPNIGVGLPGYDAGMAPAMAPLSQPAMPQAQGITGATTLADLVSRGLGGLGMPSQAAQVQSPQQPYGAPQMPQLAAQPFAQAMPQAPVAAPQMAPQAAFPQAPGIAQAPAPAAAPMPAPQAPGLGSLFAQPPAPPQVQSPQQPYGQAPIPAPIPFATPPAYQPSAPAQQQYAPQAPAPAPAPAAPAPAPVAPAPVRQAAPAPAPVARALRGNQIGGGSLRGVQSAEANLSSREVNPEEDFPEALAARRANQRADGSNDPGRPYQPAPYERPDEPAPIEQPQEQPAEAPVEPELEPAMAGSPLQNAQPAESAIQNGELMIAGRDGRRFSRSIGDDAGGKGVNPNLLSRVGLTRAILSQFVDRSVIGTMNVPDRPMDNADDVAALAYEYLRKQPQENFMAVILDGQGRPIQILRHALGNISSTSFMPHVIAGVAASTRGARTVYMVHNHPSTTTRFSAADITAAQSLSKTIESIGLRFGGSLVVTDGDAHEGNMTPKYIFHAGGELVEHTPAARSENYEGDKQTDPRAIHPVVVFDDRPGSETTAEIQVVERLFEVRKNALFPRIAQSKDAVEQIPPLLANKPGIALIDHAGRLVGVVHMSIGEMRNVSSSGSMIYPQQGQNRDYISSEDDRAPGETDKRPYKRTEFSKDSQAGAWNNPLAMLMAALERSNAERVIISIGAETIGTSGKDVRSEAVKNLQKALLRTAGKKVETIDVVSNTKALTELVLQDTFYNGSYSTNPDEKGARLSTGRRTGFNEEGAAYGEQGQGDQAPIEQAPKSLGDVVSQGMNQGSSAHPGANEGDSQYGVEEGKKKPKTMSLVFYDSAVKGYNSERDGNEDKDRKATAVIGPDGVIIKGYSQFADAEISLDQWDELMSDLKKNGEARVGREHGIYDADLVITSAKAVKEDGANYGVAETNPEDPNAGAEFARQEREAGARVNLPSGLDNAQPAAPVIKTRKPRAKKAAGAAPVNVSAFARLDATPGAFGRLSGEQMKQFGLSDAMLDQFVEHSTYGQIPSGVQTVKTADDAAHVAAGMRKRPQEQLVLLITDKNGKPLQIAAHQLNGPTACGFNPGILAGTAASTPGAANVWVIHNHPSQKSSLSPADLTAGDTLARLLTAANLNYKGMMAVAGQRYAFVDSKGNMSGGQKIQPHPRKYTIPLTERMFAYAVAQNGIVYSDPLVVGQDLRRIFGDDQPGIVLMDNSNRPVAAIPLDGDVMTAMKATIPGENPGKQTGFGKYVAGIDRSNAVNMVLYTAGMDRAWATKVINNMSGVAQSTKITLLDVLDNKEVSRQNDIPTYGSNFNESAAAYNAGESADKAPQSLGDVVEQGLAGPKKKSDEAVAEPGAGDKQNLSVERAFPQGKQSILFSDAATKLIGSNYSVHIEHGQNLMYPVYAPSMSLRDKRGNYIASASISFNKKYIGKGKREKVELISSPARKKQGFPDAGFSALIEASDRNPDFSSKRLKGVSRSIYDEAMVGFYREIIERLRQVGVTRIKFDMLGHGRLSIGIEDDLSGEETKPNGNNWAAFQVAMEKSHPDAEKYFDDNWGEAIYALDPNKAFEPGAAYDDGENTVIPGGEREKALKFKATQAALRAKNELPGGMDKAKARAEAERMFGADVIAGLVDSGVLTFANSAQEADPTLSPMEAAEMGNAGGWALDGKAVIIATKIGNPEDLRAVILHEIGQHLGFGESDQVVNDFFNDTIKAYQEGNAVAGRAVHMSVWAMLNDSRYDAVSKLGERFQRFRGMDFESFSEGETAISPEDMDALLDVIFEPVNSGNEIDEYERRAFAGVLMEEVGAYIENALSSATEAELARPLWKRFCSAVNMVIYKMTNGRVKLGSFTPQDIRDMHIGALRAQARAGKANDRTTPVRARFSIKTRNLTPGSVPATNSQQEIIWRKSETNPEKNAGTVQWVKALDERLQAGADPAAEMEALGVPTQINMPGGAVLQMPGDLVQKWIENASRSIGEVPSAYTIENPKRVERLLPGNFNIAEPSAPGEGINPASEMKVDGQAVFKEGHPLLNGATFVMQNGVQQGSGDNNAGYGFQHGCKHAMEIMFAYANRTKGPGETESDVIDRITDGGKNGIKAYTEALDYFYKRADVKVSLVDQNGKEVKVTLVDSRSGVQLNGRLTASGQYSFTTSFHAAIPSGFFSLDGKAEDIRARFNNGIAIKEDMEKRDQMFDGSADGLDDQAGYAMSFDTNRLFAGEVPPGSTVKVDASLAPEAMKSALKQAVKNVGNSRIDKATTEQEKADLLAKKQRIRMSVAMPPPSNYPPPVQPTPPGAAPVNPELSAAQRAWDIVTMRYFSGISDKAHQNARRFAGPSIQAVADMIHNRPGSQGSAAPRSIPTSIMAARGKYINRFRDIMEPMRDHLSAMTTASREQFYADLTDQITGRRRVATGFVGKIATDLQQFLAELHAYRVQAGEDLGEIQDYFPVVYNSDLISKNRAAFLSDAERAYKIELSKTMSGPQLDSAAAASALALYNTHVRGMAAPDFGSLMSKTSPSMRENSSQERVFGRQAQNIMRSWQSNDPFLVMTRYIGGAVKSAEVARKFGADGSGWEKYAVGMEAEGVPHEVIDEMHELVCQAAGLGTAGLGKAGQSFMDSVALYTAATSLGKSFMSNLFEPITMGIRTGNPLNVIRAYAETWTRSVNEYIKDKPIVNMLSNESFWQQYGEHIGTIHNSLDDAWMTTHSMELGMDNQNPRMRWLTNRVYKANMMDATETAKQQASHAIGHSYLGDLCKMTAGTHWMNSFGMDASRSAARDLTELGVPEADHQAFAAWMETLRNTPANQRFAVMTDGSPMSKLYEEAQVRFTNQTAVRANRAHRPVFQDNLMGKMFLQLQSFTYSYAAEANSRIYDNAKQSIMSGDYNAIDRLRLAAPALMLPLAIVAFGVMFKLRRDLFPTEASIKRENEPWWAKFLDAASYAGVFGPKIEQSMKFVMRDQPPGGVVGAEVIGMGRAVKNYAKAQIVDEEKRPGAMATANRSAVRAAIPPVKGAFVAGAAALHPVLGTAAVMATNDTTLSNAALEATDEEKPDKKREPENPYKYRNPYKK